MSSLHYGVRTLRPGVRASGYSSNPPKSLSEQLVTCDFRGAKPTNHAGGTEVLCFCDLLRRCGVGEGDNNGDGHSDGHSDGVATGSLRGRHGVATANLDGKPSSESFGDHP